jgi:DNA polymerase-3 subunit epsilon
VVELGLVLLDDGAVVERWGALLDPERALPEDVTRITGIKPEDLRGAPTFAAIAPALRARLQGRLLAAYNASFDRGFLLQELHRCGAEPPDAAWVDPLVMAKQLQRGQGKMKLGVVAERLGIALEEAHRAVADAECAALVLLALAEQMPADLDATLDQLEAWEAAQNAARAGWRRSPRGGTGGAIADDGPRDALGPGYPHGDELDPVRFMFLRGTGRR